MCKPVFGFVAWYAGAEMSASSCIRLQRVEFCRALPAGGKHKREESVLSCSKRQSRLASGSNKLLGHCRASAIRDGLAGLCQPCGCWSVPLASLEQQMALALQGGFSVEEGLCPGSTGLSKLGSPIVLTLGSGSTSSLYVLCLGSGWPRSATGILTLCAFYCRCVGHCRNDMIIVRWDAAEKSPSWLH